MAKVIITLTDENKGFDLDAHIEFEPKIPEGMLVEDLPTPVRAAFVALDALNALSASGGADFLEVNDGEELYVGPGKSALDLLTEGGV